MISKKNIQIIFCALLCNILSAQITNQEIVAEIKTEEVLDLITVTGVVKSKTEIIESLRYVMYVYRENLETSNVSKNEQSGRVVLDPNASKELSKTTINKTIKDKVTVLLMIYDLDDKLVAKARSVILNDDEEKEKPEVKQLAEQEREYIGLRGIVMEETKTKPGRDFYIDFYSNYRLRGINGKEVVKITEQFSFGVNTIMEVSVGGKVVYRFFVQPTSDYIKKQSQQAIIAVARQLMALENQKNLIRQY
ncbi:CsgE family curli-type amyloid fiber assembly protein [uncultured Winogradskyella sp.]|uniref:CsgE family curli-type amyloid fiber assembly protein n=1 Tax=uncultured Winogradskyella sp. TaxID=395353 RepID=UPI0035191F8A